MRSHLLTRCAILSAAHRCSQFFNDICLIPTSLSHFERSIDGQIVERAVKIRRDACPPLRIQRWKWRGRRFRRGMTVARWDGETRHCPSAEIFRLYGTYFTDNDHTSWDTALSKIIIIPLYLFHVDIQRCDHSGQINMGGRAHSNNGRQTNGNADGKTIQRRGESELEETLKAIL